MIKSISGLKRINLIEDDVNFRVLDFSCLTITSFFSLTVLIFEPGHSYYMSLDANFL